LGVYRTKDFSNDDDMHAQLSAFLNTAGGD
jgi:hypothetical protein